MVPGRLFTSSAPRLSRWIQTAHAPDCHANVQLEGTLHLSSVDGAAMHGGNGALGVCEEEVRVALERSPGKWFYLTLIRSHGTRSAANTLTGPLSVQLIM